jgi:hypothetical protein
MLHVYNVLMNSLPWRPLLSGEEASRVYNIVEEIATATSNVVSVRPGNVGAQVFSAWQNSLDGLAGQSLFHAYLALHGAGDAYAETAVELLDKATQAVAELRLPPSLYFGFSGIAWVTAHLAGRLFEEREDSCLEVDELLLRSLSNSSWGGQYDLFEGLVGLGVYALERLPRPSGMSLLEAVVDHLSARAERGSGGASFFSPPENLPGQYRDMYPNGNYNLGMAHGAAGVIAFLGAACHAGVAPEQARRLLTETITWLLDREQPRRAGLGFPNVYSLGFPAGGSRLAWCHSDLGVATALLVAARGTGEKAWEAEARRIAGAAAACPVEEAHVADAEICHGAAGVGHLFNRLYQATGEASLGESAQFWLRRALAMREPSLGVAGFRMSQAGSWFDHPGFRIGASGIGLSLLASISSVEPTWDRLLLASLRSPAAR